jgi:hypothetical protein
MSNKSRMPFLERCGLSFDELAYVANRPDPRESACGRIFSVRMLNEVTLTHRDHPSVPTAKGRLELVHVKLRNDLLTISNIEVLADRGCGQAVESAGVQFYAMKTVAMNGATAFMFLKELPLGVSDDKFFPAEGTVVLYEDARKGRRALRACGIDGNGGQSVGWIFHAMET